MFAVRYLKAINMIQVLMQNMCFGDLGVGFTQKSCLCYSNHFRTNLNEQIAGQSIRNNTKFNKFGFFLDWK